MFHNTAPESNFYGLGIAPKLLSAISKLKFISPTPIQEKAIPVAIEGKDLIGIAQTGTGKTLAFGIPMLQRLATIKTNGLIILPTRELAMQVEETLQKLGRDMGLKTALLIGGASMRHQQESISRNPHIVIGTPGRINDHLERKGLSLKNVGILVLDEADRMLDMGFAPQINKILKEIPKDRQTMLFSATMPDEIARIATQSMKLPLRIEIARPGSAAEQVDQELIIVKRENKFSLLQKILDEYKGSVLVFSRTKWGAKKIARALRDMKYTSTEIHSERSLFQRKEALEGFKSGKYKVLVATDIASRGIDVKNIELVINFDIPDDPSDYIHRIGRTGRAGNAGKAISFATPDQKSAVREIEKLLKTAIAVSNMHEFPFWEKQSSPQRKNFGRKTFHKTFNRRNFKGSRFYR